MKRYLRFIALMISAQVLLAACEEDTLPDVNYQSSFVGTWNVLEKTGLNAPQSYVVEITPGPTENQIIIGGLYNNALTVINANITGLDLDIAQQTTDGISFSGDGRASVNFDQITINFTANDGSGDDQVTAVLAP